MPARRQQLNPSSDPDPSPSPSSGPSPSPSSNPDPNPNPNQEEAELRKSSRKRAIKSLNDAGKLPGNHIKHLFTDVYDEQAPHHLALNLALTPTLALTLLQPWLWPRPCSQP